MAAFCPCTNNLPEAKLESNGLLSLTEEISRPSNIDSVACVISNYSYVNLQGESAYVAKRKIKL